MDFTVIENLIDEDVLQSQPDIDLVRKKINELVKAGFLKEISTNEFIFKDYVTWEIVYETLLYAERRHLHELIANHIEKNKANELGLYAAKLVFHYEKAENYKKTVFYSALAGDRAFELYAIDDALEFYNKSLLNLTKINNYAPADKSMLLEKKADVIESTGMYTEAIKEYEDSIKLIQNQTHTQVSLLPWNPNVRNRRATLYHKISVAYERSLQYEKSLNYLDLSEKYLPARPGELPIKISATRSVINYRKYDYDAAMDYAKLSLSLSRKRKSNKHISYAYNIIANIYSSLGNVDKSIIYFDKALSSYETLNDLVGVSMCYYNLGTSYSMIPDFEKSNEYFFKSIEVNKKMQNAMAVMQDQFMIGNNKLQIKELDDALFYLNKSVGEYKENMGREDVYGICLSRIAEAYVYKDKLSEASEYINKSLAILSDVDELPDALAQAKIVLVELLLKEQKLNEAEELCKELIEQFHEMQIPNLEVYVMKQLARVYWGMNQLAMSNEILEQAYNLANSIDSTYDILSIELMYEKTKVFNNEIDEGFKPRVAKLFKGLKKYQIWQDLEMAEELLQV